MRRPGQALTEALLQMATDGRRPMCGDWSESNPWLAEDPGLRAMAARWCEHCPVLAECDQAAREMKVTAGVWAGLDRTKRERGAKQ